MVTRTVPIDGALGALLSWGRKSEKSISSITRLLRNGWLPSKTLPFRVDSLFFLRVCINAYRLWQCPRLRLALVKFPFDLRVRRFSVFDSVRKSLLGTLAVLILLPSAALPQQVINGCSVFPPNNIWNRRIDTLPLDPNSSTYVSTIGASTHFHPDVGNDINSFGIPYNLTKGKGKILPSFDYADESDPGPYPVTTKLLIEGGTWSTVNAGDRHVLMVDTKKQVLYELYATYPSGKKGIHAGSGAIFPLNSNALRPNGWTSADAAGLPVFPGLLNFDEVATGSVKHALRFTTRRTNGYIWPARHQAGPQTAGYPPMGQRFRLRANFNVSTYSPRMQVVLNCLKQYGMIVADNGSNWYMSGAPDRRWNNEELDQLKNLVGSDFEAVDERALMVNPDSGQSL